MLMSAGLPLPEQVFSPAQLRCFERLAAMPNFVTDRVVRGEVVCLSANSSPDIDVEGKIAVIPRYLRKLDRALTQSKRDRLRGLTESRGD